MFCEIKTFGPTKCSPQHATLKIHANVKLSSMDTFKILSTRNPINYKISTYCSELFLDRENPIEYLYMNPGFISGAYCGILFKLLLPIH